MSFYFNIIQLKVSIPIVCLFVCIWRWWKPLIVLKNVKLFLLFVWRITDRLGASDCLSAAIDWFLPPLTVDETRFLVLVKLLQVQCDTFRYPLSSRCVDGWWVAVGCTCYPPTWLVMVLELKRVRRRERGCVSIHPSKDASSGGQPQTRLTTWDSLVFDIFSGCVIDVPSCWPIPEVTFL